MGFSNGLYSSISGLKNAQTNLAVTGQNISNSTVAGYTRQQVVQGNSKYLTIGNCATGSLKMQIGLGTDALFIRQIRDKFFDTSYREQNSMGNYYATKYTAGSEISEILGELQGEYKVSQVIEDLSKSINDLIMDPSAIETRNLFIQTCVSFIDKMINISDNLYEYQKNLNEQIKQQVSEINEIVSKINDLNNEIVRIESSGTSKANDLRDERNVLIDELSAYVGIEVKEVVTANGHSDRIDILVNGNVLLSNGHQNKIGLKYVNGEYPFVEPVFSNSESILPADSNATRLYPNLQEEDLSTISEKTTGSLKALLISRGETIGNFVSSDAEVNNFLIPRLQRELDKLSHSVVVLLNEAVAPTDGTEQPFNLNGEQVPTQIFIRKSGAAIEVEEDENNFSTLYSIRNLEVNPELLNGDGYTLLSFSATGAVNDTTILENMNKQLKEPKEELNNTSINNFYKKIITDFAVEINDAQENYNTQVSMIESIDNKRTSISAVSLDEELSNMLRFQYAYNAAAKVINVIDGMIEKLVNS